MTGPITGGKIAIPQQPSGAGGPASTSGGRIDKPSDAREGGAHHGGVEGKIPGGSVGSGPVVGATAQAKDGVQQQGRKGSHKRAVPNGGSTQADVGSRTLPGCFPKPRFPHLPRLPNIPGLPTFPRKPGGGGTLPEGPRTPKTPVQQAPRPSVQRPSVPRPSAPSDPMPTTRGPKQPVTMPSVEPSSPPAKMPVVRQHVGDSPVLST